jgi:hypothetical protein
MAVSSRICRYPVPLAIAVGVFLLLPTFESTLRQYTPKYWNGHGECPINDPFGEGLDTLRHSLAYAHHIDDRSSMRRIHGFILHRTQEEYQLASAELVDYWNRDRRVPSEEPQADLERTWSLYEESLEEHGPDFAWMTFQPNGHGRNITFQQGATMAVFSFVPKTPMHV